MRPAERRIYDGLCAYLAKLSARAHASYIQELTEQTRWQDDGGRTSG